MNPDERDRRARSLLDRFAAATGLTSDAAPRRYLWTDAFAVCTWAGLGRDGRNRAERLVDAVHHTLGRHRDDDPRSGWISGLDEAAGAARPTAGGLRIGKPRPERPPDAAYDPRLEWDRDGQYYHYLTKWMRALARLAVRADDRRYRRWATELATVAFDAFSHGPAGSPDRLYWKMSIDLTRPLVPSMGQHDPLDGYVVCSELRSEAAPSASAGLDRAIAALAAMGRGASWATDDPLGAGSLLTDAWFLARLGGSGGPERADVLERVLEAAVRSVAAVLRSRTLERPASQRLAFRELGLSLGLAAVERLAAALEDAVAPGPAPGVEDRHAGAVRELARAVPLRAEIESFWVDPESQAAPTWAEHQDISTAMLAASLAPDGCLGPGWL